MLGDGLVKGQFVIADGGRILLGVGGIDAVHAGALQQGVGLDFQGPERRAGVGREKGIARAAGDQGHTAALQDLDGLVAHVILGHRLHRRGRKDLRLDALLLDEHRQGEGVDHRREHAHLVAVDAVEALSGALQAAEDVAAAVDDGNLQPGLRGRCDFLRRLAEAVRIESLSGRSAEGFAAEFE